VNFEDFKKMIKFSKTKEKEIWNHLQEIIDSKDSQLKELRANFDNLHEAFVRAAKENDGLRKAMKYYANPKIYDGFVDLSTTAQRVLNENLLH
jgi:hypothetical protein